MSLLKLIWQAIPCILPHDGLLDIQPGLIRLRCAKCGRVTDGVEVPTFEEWQQAHWIMGLDIQPNQGFNVKVLEFKRRAS